MKTRACATGCGVALVATATIGAIAYFTLTSWLQHPFDVRAFRGATLCALGDVDHDGASDFALGCFARNTVWVFSGRTGALLREFEGNGVTSEAM